MPEPTYKIAQRLLASRAAVGVKQYGDDLTANSLGCMIVQALEEAADEVNYLLAEIQRRKYVIEKLESLAEEMRADKAPVWAFELQKLSDLLGGEAALAKYDEILGSGTIAENAKVATDAKPCSDCRSMLTTEPKCCQCNERDALRAELAAAKNLLARIHSDGGHHTEAVGFTQSVADAEDKVSEWLLAKEAAR